MAQHVWGNEETQFFYQLTPEKILNAVEKELGVKCTGRTQALNSMENRVYEIEIELDEPPTDPSQAFLIAKFYRPGRWTKPQIEEEHEFLAELDVNEIPVVAPFVNEDQQSVFTHEETGLFFTIFPKQGGRSPDELDDKQMEQVGRLLSRMHSVGAMHPAKHRITLTPDSYGRQNLEFLLSQDLVPVEVRSAYENAVNALCDAIDKPFRDVRMQRLHGDCHMGNLLFGRQGMFWVDFDDMVMGPCVQDIWLLIPGRDDYAKLKLEKLLTGYESMGHFDRATLKLIEPLRALRYIHFTAWIAKRWKDPAFPKAFPYFGTMKYWQEQLLDLREQSALIQDT